MTRRNGNGKDNGKPTAPSSVRRLHPRLDRASLDQDHLARRPARSLRGVHPPSQPELGR